MYLLDADSLITANRHDFPIDRNPGTFWNLLEDMGNKEQIRIPEAVFEEIERGGDNLLKWLVERKQIFMIPKTEAFSRITEVLDAYGPMTDIQLEQLNGKADPFLIAHALLLNAIVITNEVSNPNTINPIKKQIPDICSYLEVSCIRYPRFLWEIRPYAD